MNTLQLKDHQEFIDGIYNVMMIMGVMPIEKAESVAYQLKSVAQVCYNQQKKEFKGDFLNNIIPFYMREEKRLESINLIYV